METTTIGYRDVLTQLWLLDPVPAWSATRNTLTRLAAAQKHHLADPALAARLPGADVGALMDDSAGGGRPVRRGPLLGALFESLVTLRVRAYAQTAEASPEHLRTRDGDHEVDLVVQRGDGRVVAVEVKLSPEVTSADAVHLRWLADRLGLDLLDTVAATTARCPSGRGQPARGRRDPLDGAVRRAHRLAGRDVVLVLVTPGASERMLAVLDGEVDDVVLGGRRSPVAEGHPGPLTDGRLCIEAVRAAQVAEWAQACGVGTGRSPPSSPCSARG